MGYSNNKTNTQGATHTTAHTLYYFIDKESEQGHRDSGEEEKKNQ